MVTVTDDGGSSGRLRREFDVLPPGDIRNCMVALSEDEALLARLFQYRFHRTGARTQGPQLRQPLSDGDDALTGDFAQAVKLCSEVLAVAGRIYPSTASNVVLEATLADGTQGGRRIAHQPQHGADSTKSRCGRGSVKPLPETLEAIANADLITLGPGSLFTSVIPNLLVDGIPRGHRRLARAARRSS